MSKLIQNLWDNYTEITPSVTKIKSIFKLNNDFIFADHIAYRSINIGSCGIEKISQPFLDIGYKVKKTYFFKDKKLRAIHLENETSKKQPKIFISELLLENCSYFLRNILLSTFCQLNFSSDILSLGRNWDVKYDVYKQLESESEYAAWLYIHGLRVNHFALNVNQLNGCSIEGLCNKLQTLGVVLNNSGGIIKGTKAKGLKQASTMADKILVEFEDMYHKILIPSCYVEFTQRYMIKKTSFNGFLTKSANKIFDSTNRISTRSIT